MCFLSDFCSKNSLKLNHYVLLMWFLVQGQLKEDFTYITSYDLTVVDGFSTNSTQLLTYLKVIFSVKQPKHLCTFNSLVGLLCNSCQNPPYFNLKCHSKPNPLSLCCLQLH